MANKPSFSVEKFSCNIELKCYNVIALFLNAKYTYQGFLKFSIFNSIYMTFYFPYMTIK